MARPMETVWPIEGHTKAKHRILRGYLDAWLPIMSQHNGRLVYVDGFAGPGIYAGGEPGSPIIALKAFLEHKYRERIASELVYVFIEENKERVESLREEVRKLGELPPNVKIEIDFGTYEGDFRSDPRPTRGRRQEPRAYFCLRRSIRIRASEHEVVRAIPSVQ